MSVVGMLDHMFLLAFSLSLSSRPYVNGIARSFVETYETCEKNTAGAVKNDDQNADLIRFDLARLQGGPRAREPGEPAPSTTNESFVI